MAPLPYFSLGDLSSHCFADDCWIALFGRVLDLTPLVQKAPSALAAPIVKFAGQDLSHWFDENTLEPLTRQDPQTGAETYFLPHGRFVDVPSEEPTADEEPLSPSSLPWWRDHQRYQVGVLSKRARKLRLLNMLTSQEDELSVCEEETLEDIRQKYLRLNSHAKSYTWKYLGEKLQMEKTLEGNGMADNSDELADLGLNEDEFVPTIYLYFNDDLTEE